MQTFERKDFWAFILSFWGNLSTEDKLAWQSLWNAIEDVGENIFNKVQRLKLVADPNNVDYSIKDYIDVKVGILNSISINLDPTKQQNNKFITPIRTILQPPIFNGTNNEYFDLIQLFDNDFYKIINIALDQYVVIIPDNKNIPVKYFN